jgi:hypothetical protein
MQKVIPGVAVSLDGFIEGPNGEYDWCFTDQDWRKIGFQKTAGLNSFRIYPSSMAVKQ